MVSTYVTCWRIDLTALSDYGSLLLGSRLKRLSDALFAGVDAVYRSKGLDISARGVPILLLLRDNGPLSITEVAFRLGQSHPAVSQMARKLLQARMVVEQQDVRDERRRLLALSRKGRTLLESMQPIWRSVVGAIEALAQEAKVDLLGTVAALENGLQQRTCASRIEEWARLSTADDVEIIPFEPRYRSDFKRLNVEWIDKYFYLEELDDLILSHPEERILKPGGFVFLARLHEEIVGTCALLCSGKQEYEVSKMAVTERCQGMKIGTRLLQAIIDKAQALDSKKLWLESNSKLKSAIRLYEATGFAHATPPKGAPHYQRVDVYMVYRPGRGGLERQGGR